MKRKYILAASVLVLAFAACQDKETKLETQAPEVAVVEVPRPVLGNYGVATENMDTSVKPGDNFFKYVNGTWLKNTQIPDDKSNYGSFTILADLSDERVKGIIEKAALKDAPVGSEEQKIGDFYQAYMDVDTIDAAGLSPVQSDLAKIMAVTTREKAAALMGDPTLALESPVAGWVDVDLKDISNYIFYLTQSGLGMPNRSYYLDEDDKSKALRTAYLTFLETLLTKAGFENPDRAAKNVMAFETDLATAHWTPEKRRDRSLTYNKMTMKELQNYAKGLPWEPMLAASGLFDQKTFIVREKDAFKGMADAFAKADVETLKAYMAAHYLSGLSAYLPKDIDDASFEFYGKALRGTEVQRERWKRAVGAIDATMGEMVGKVYVENYFPPESKTQMDALVENLRAAFRDGIENLTWMEDATKAEAQDKLQKFTPKIGYPTEWKDYSDLAVTKGDLIGTVKSARNWQWQEEIGKLGGPIDRGEWGMNPQTVNAYYRASLNEIVFPAAILQAPFFDPNADPAVNYGGIGAVIGHEMGHGFDDQGRKVDGNGEQRDWWTKADGEAFKARTDDLVTQFNAFEPLPGLNVNGELTLGENIGDLTGLTMAYAAYKNSLNGEEAPIIDGTTGDQRFFLAFGQIWQRKFREEALRERVKTDPHSPGEYRANGIVRNFDPWYAAFNVQPGDALYLPPEKRVKIW